MGNKQSCGDLFTLQSKSYKTVVQEMNVYLSNNTQYENIHQF